MKLVSSVLVGVLTGGMAALGAVAFKNKKQEEAEETAKEIIDSFNKYEGKTKEQLIKNAKIASFVIDNYDELFKEYNGDYAKIVRTISIRMYKEKSLGVE